MLLHPKQIVRSTRSEAEYSVVGGVVAEGGQGELYRVTAAGKIYALKWYLPTYPPQDPKLWRRLQSNIDDGPPTPRFLWPFDLVGLDRQTPAGYVMPWTDYPSLVPLMNDEMDPDPSFRVIATAGLGFAEDFSRLHARGRYYSDISPNNVFFDPASGDVRIGDTDNVAIKNEGNPTSGTEGYIAPEIVRGEAEPSRLTDLHSLAVLLFVLLMVEHPLKGKREVGLPYDPTDPAGMRRLCASPVFIWDPHDDSNRPIPEVHINAIAYWPIYPQFLRDLFTRAFTDGLKYPDRRIAEDEWRRAMARLRDAIFLCQHCGAENFYDLDHMRTARLPAPCWHCQKTPPLPPRLRIDDARNIDPLIVMLAPDAELFPHHLDGDPANFSAPLARVEAAPLRLRNRSGRVWSGRTAEGAVLAIKPGEALLLDQPCQIHFGRSEGRIAVSAEPVAG